MKEEIRILMELLEELKARNGEILEELRTANIHLAAIEAYSGTV